MNILGFEVKRVGIQSASESSFSKTASQETKPSRAITVSDGRETIGDSGTIGLHGIIGEEYIGKLQGRNGMFIYDEMRKSDSTVRAVISAVTLPIRRAEWFVKAGGIEPQDELVKEFIEHMIFDWGEMSWDDILRQALLMIPFGVMPFEKVFGIKNWDGKDYVITQKLAPRLPKSIMQWELTDGTFGIQQIRQDGISAQIPGDKLVVFINDREGDNYWGTPLLRSMYRNWETKRHLYNIESASIERQGMGVPYAKGPKGYTSQQLGVIKKTLGNLRANQAGYVVYPEDWEIGFLDMKGHTVIDPQPAIMHHNREMAKAALSQFLELGSQKVGSHALSEDQSTLFLKSIETVANTIAATINREWIKQMVDMNFEGVTNYPVIDFAKIEQQDVEKLATAYSSLVTAGVITVTKTDEDYLRATMGLPEFEDGDEKDISSNELEDHVNADLMIDDTVDPNNPEKPRPQKTAAGKPAPADTKNKDGKKETPANIEKNKAKKDAEKKAMSENKFKPWRKLTFAEQKVNFQKIQDTMDKLESDFTMEAKNQLNADRDVFMAAATRAITDNDLTALRALEVGFVATYTAILRKYMNQSYEYGKTSASREIGVLPPANDLEIITNIGLMAEAIAQKAAADIESKAKMTIANARSTSMTKAQTIGATDNAMENAINKSINGASATQISGNLSLGRNSVFSDNPDNIYALQRSELLDDKTCNFCISIDGRIIELNDPMADSTQYHSDCRGLWVAIMKDEAELPPIEGIPQSILDHFGGEVNALIQPKTPITKAGSLADQFVKSKK